MDGLAEYLSYHRQSSIAKDIDPQNDCLQYVANRFELNMEQRYWLAFLFGTCYCAPTVYYIYNEFPDYNTVNIDRLEKWWKANKDRLVFETDRQRVRSNDQFVQSFISYRQIVGKNQENHFSAFKKQDPKATYANAFESMSDVFSFGRFTMFIYLEMVSVLTNCKMIPIDLDLKNAESCRNGSPSIYDAQLAVINEKVPPKFRFGRLFTSSISNFNIPAPFHRDAGNLEGCVNVIIAKKKNARGGNTTVPDYGATVDSRDNSMLVYPAWRNVHGVTPIVPTQEGGYRNSLVFYPLKAFNNYWDEK